MTCRRPPTASSPTDVTLTVVAGDGQFGPPSQFLIDSLTVAVLTKDGGVAVNLSSFDGGPVSRNSALRLKLVRLF